MGQLLRLCTELYVYNSGNTNIYIDKIKHTCRQANSFPTVNTPGQTYECTRISTLNINWNSACKWSLSKNNLVSDIKIEIWFSLYLLSSKANTCDYFNQNIPITHDSPMSRGSIWQHLITKCMPSVKFQTQIWYFLFGLTCFKYTNFDMVFFYSYSKN